MLLKRQDGIENTELALPGSTWMRIAAVASNGLTA